MAAIGSNPASSTEPKNSPSLNYNQNMQISQMENESLNPAAFRNRNMVVPSVKQPQQQQETGVLPPTNRPSQYPLSNPSSTTSPQQTVAILNRSYESLESNVQQPLSSQTMSSCMESPRSAGSIHHRRSVEHAPQTPNINLAASQSTPQTQSVNQFAVGSAAYMNPAQQAAYGYGAQDFSSFTPQNVSNQTPHLQHMNVQPSQSSARSSQKLSHMSQQQQTQMTSDCYYLPPTSSRHGSHLNNNEKVARQATDRQMAATSSASASASAQHYQPYRNMTSPLSHAAAASGAYGTFQSAFPPSPAQYQMAPAHQYYQQSYKFGPPDIVPQALNGNLYVNSAAAAAYMTQPYNYFAAANAAAAAPFLGSAQPQMPVGMMSFPPAAQAAVPGSGFHPQDPRNAAGSSSMYGGYYNYFSSPMMPGMIRK